MRKHLAWVLFILLAGCGGGKGGSGSSAAQIVITPNSGSIAVGETQQFTAKVYDAKGALMSGSVTWTSTDSSVAGINASGLATASNPGRTTITASIGSVVGNGVALTVTPGPIASIEVSPPQASVDIGGAFQFSAVAKDSAGNQVKEIAGLPVANGTFIWKTIPLDTTLVSIDTNGLATGHVTRNYQITASTTDGKIVSPPVSLVVGSCPSDTAPQQVLVAPAEIRVTRTHTAQFTAVAKNASGQIICGASFTWGVTDLSIASIGASGLATGLKFGTVTVTAAQGVVSGSAQLIVSPFLQPTRYTTGLGPQAIAVADYNSDGLQDLATANLDGKDVSILSNRPSQPGAFDLPLATDLLADGLVSLVSSQFNSVISPDSHPDLAVVDINEGALYSLLNNGNGTMGLLDKLLIPGGPIFIAAADFNHDNKIDLITADIASNTLSLLMGKGDGRFNPPQTILLDAGARGPLFILADDFNGDGNPDLAVVNSGSNTLTILLGNGAGAFGFGPGSPISFGSQPVSAASGKFHSGSGVARDLAVVSKGAGGAGTVQVLFGNGDGTFAAPTSTVLPSGTIPTSIAAGDFDGDGLDDWAVTDGMNGRVFVYTNSPAQPGQFSEGDYFNVGSNPQQVLSGTFVDAQRLDLAVVNSGSNNVSILLHSK